MSDKKADKSGWLLRRRYMFAVSTFFMWMIVYILIKDKDTVAARTAIEVASYGLMFITGSYVFGAAWDDMNRMKFTPSVGTTTSTSKETVSVSRKEKDEDKGD